jgi:hypothetical protein
VLAFSGIVCVAPLQFRGLRGKNSTPSVGWEVPVRSCRSKRVGQSVRRTTTLEHSHLAKVHWLSYYLQYNSIYARLFYCT